LTAGRQYTLRVTQHDEVERILAQIRQAGLVIEDLQLHQADLEDVFIQVMGAEQ
jgi:ABC-2 type transport system ATP-binding protein